MRPEHLYEPYDIEPFWKRIDWYGVFLYGNLVILSLATPVLLVMAILAYLGIL